MTDRRSTSTSRSAPDYRVVILGAGRTVRGSTPSAVAPVNGEGCVLDWLLAAFSVLEAPDVCFVGGYGADAVLERYRDIRFRLNPDWDSTGPAASLSLAPLSSASATYISYADVVYRPELIRCMESIDSDVVVAMDGRWRVRYDGRSQAERERAEKVVCTDNGVVGIGRHIPASDATAEFAGVLRLSAGAASLVSEELTAGVFDRTAGVPELVNRLIDLGLSVVGCEVNGQWAELAAAQDLARFVLGTKAESLQRLKPLVRGAHIGEMVTFMREEWRGDRPRVLRRVLEAFPGVSLIVRSTAASEDTWAESAAGKHKSIPNVPAGNTEALGAAVDAVFESYTEPGPDDAILVQEMLRDVSMSGVVLTRTLSLGAPYYVINYDDTTSRTDSVTSGDARSPRTLFLHRGTAANAELSHNLRRLIEVVRELEALVGHDSLDIEFALTQDGRAHVLQVRPIAVARPDHPVDDARIALGIENARRFFRELQEPSPWLLGSSTSLSVMSDWNPAEIVGTKPSRLAFSLYRHLITDEAWAAQRAEFGYRDVRPCNLIVDLLGHPYVDVRAVFNSFIPAALPDDLAASLVEYYLARLADQPELHDKVEFDILHTCLTFDFSERAKGLLDAGLRRRDVEMLADSLRKITRDGIARCAGDVAALQDAERRFERIRHSDVAPLERAYLLLEDARLHGVPLFAHLARNAFVAVALLRSLKAIGILTDRQVDDFLASIRTVSSAIKEDGRLVAAGRLSWDTFVERYGHLRPGTYDISSPRYADDPEEYLRPVVDSKRNREGVGRATPWTDRTRDVIDAALKKLDLGVDYRGFEGFLRRAIEGRELGKFIFTKNLSAALEALAEFGEAHGIKREDMAHVRIADLLALRSAGAEDVTHALRRLVSAGREAFYVTQAVCLPAQIFSEADLACFEQCKTTPNFVTRKRVRALVDALVPKAGPIVNLSGKIALMPNADPGFDWIFSRDIAGLVTMYGGANSHMAIRAAEFKLPAAIGVGEALYRELGDAEMIELDCATRRIKTVR